MKHQTPNRHQRLKTWLAFLRAHSRITAILEQELEDAQHLSMSWFDVLEQLRQMPGHELRMQDLSDMLAMSASGLSRRITRMERAGLVERHPCPDDRRGVIVRLTSHGERRYRKALPVHLRGVERYFLHVLDDEDVTILTDVFARVLEQLDVENSVGQVRTESRDHALDD